MVEIVYFIKNKIEKDDFIKTANVSKSFFGVIEINVDENDWIKGQKSLAEVKFSFNSWECEHYQKNHSHCARDRSGTLSSLHTQLDSLTFNYIFPAYWTIIYKTQIEVNDVFIHSLI